MQEEERTTEVRTETDRTANGSVERQTVATNKKQDSAVLAQRVIWYIAGIIIAFLLLRVVLLLLGANQGNFFVDFVYAVSGFFALPFRGIFGDPTYGEMFFDTASVVAAVVYALLAWGIAKAFTLGGAREV